LERESTKLGFQQGRGGEEDRVEVEGLRTGEKGSRGKSKEGGSKS